MINKKMMPMMLVMLILFIASLIFAVQGISMHFKVATEEAKFHQLQSDYWSLNKSVRDAAGTDSDLNENLVEIKNFPSELLRLKLVGVGKILTGIFILLFAILIALLVMPVRLGQIIKKIE